MATDARNSADTLDEISKDDLNRLLEEMLKGHFEESDDVAIANTQRANRERIGGLHEYVDGLGKSKNALQATLRQKIGPIATGVKKAIRSAARSKNITTIEERDQLIESWRTNALTAARKGRANSQFVDQVNIECDRIATELRTRYRLREENGDRPPDPPKPSEDERVWNDEELRQMVVEIKLQELGTAKLLSLNAELRNGTAVISTHEDINDASYHELDLFLNALRLAIDSTKKIAFTDNDLKKVQQALAKNLTEEMKKVWHFHSDEREQQNYRGKPTKGLPTLLQKACEELTQEFSGTSVVGLEKIADAKVEIELMPRTAHHAFLPRTHEYTFVHARKGEWIISEAEWNAIQKACAPEKPYMPDARSSRIASSLNHRFHGGLQVVHSEDLTDARIDKWKSMGDLQVSSVATRATITANQRIRGEKADDISQKWADEEYRNTIAEPAIRRCVIPHIAQLLKKLRVKTGDQSRPILTEDEVITDSHFVVLSTFLQALATELHEYINKAKRKQNAARVGHELSSMCDKLTHTVTHAVDSRSSAINAVSRDLQDLLTSCIENIRASSKQFSDEYILEVLATEFDDDSLELQLLQDPTFDPDTFLMLETVELMEMRSEAEFEWEPRPADQRILKKAYQKLTGEDTAAPVNFSARKREIGQVAAQINENNYGGKEMVTAEDVLQALQVLRQKSHGEKMPTALTDVIRFTKDEHARYACTALGLAIRTQHKEQETQSGTKYLIPESGYQAEWFAVAISTAEEVIEKRAGNILLDKQDSHERMQEALGGKQREIHNGIINECHQKLSHPAANPLPEPVAEHFNPLASLQTEQLKIAIGQPLSIHPHTPATDLADTAVLDMLGGRDPSDELELFTPEVTQLNAMLASMHKQQKFSAASAGDVDSAVELISQPGQLLEMLAGQFNKTYHGGIDYRKRLGALQSTAERLLKTIFKESEEQQAEISEREAQIIAEELGLLVESKTWPTERELHQAERRITAECYYGKHPNDFPTVRRELLQPFLNAQISPVRKFAYPTPTAIGLTDGDETPLEYRDNIREKLATEYEIVDEAIRKLVLAGRTLGHANAATMLKSVQLSVYSSGHIYKADDFDEFVRRLFEKRKNELMPETGIDTASSDTTGLEYDPNLEKVIIHTHFSVLRQRETWPTDRELMHAVRHVVRECYQGTDPLTPERRRAVLLQNFDGITPRNAFASAEPRPGLSTNDDTPFEYTEKYGLLLEKEYTIVTNSINDLIKKSEPLNEIAIQDLIDTVGKEVYGGKTWKADDLAEFCMRYYRPRAISAYEGKCTRPSLFDGAPQKSTYPDNNPFWYFESQILRQELGELIDEENGWPTEREVHCVLRRVGREVYKGPLPNRNGLREAIMDYFDPKNYVHGLALQRPIPSGDHPAPYESSVVLMTKLEQEDTYVKTALPKLVSELQALCMQDRSFPENIDTTLAFFSIEQVSTTGIDPLIEKIRDSVYAENGKTPTYAWHQKDLKVYLLRRIERAFRTEQESWLASLQERLVNTASEEDLSTTEDTEAVPHCALDTLRLAAFSQLIESIEGIAKDLNPPVSSFESGLQAIPAIQAALQALEEREDRCREELENLAKIITAHFLRVSSATNTTFKKGYVEQEAGETLEVLLRICDEQLGHLKELDAIGEAIAALGDNEYAKAVQQMHEVTENIDGAKRRLQQVRKLCADFLKTDLDSLIDPILAERLTVSNTTNEKATECDRQLTNVSSRLRRLKKSHQNGGGMAGVDTESLLKTVLELQKTLKKVVEYNDRAGSEDSETAVNGLTNLQARLLQIITTDVPNVGGRPTLNTTWGKKAVHVNMSWRNCFEDDPPFEDGIIATLQPIAEDMRKKGRLAKPPNKEHRSKCAKQVIIWENTQGNTYFLATHRGYETAYPYHQQISDSDSANIVDTLLVIKAEEKAVLLHNGRYSHEDVRLLLVAAYAGNDVEESGVQDINSTVRGSFSIFRKMQEHGIAQNRAWSAIDTAYKEAVADQDD